MKTIFVITQTVTNWLFKETETMVHSRVFLVKEDAVNELVRLVSGDLQAFEDMTEEKIRESLTSNNTEFSHNFADNMTTQYKIQETKLYDDQVEKLQNQEEYLKNYAKCIENFHQEGLLA